MTKQELAKLQALAKLIGFNAPKGPAPKKAKRTPAEIQANVEKACKGRGFKAAPVAYVNMLTYGKVKMDKDTGQIVKTGWLAQGRKVRDGEKAVFLGTLPLFHIEQTEEFTG